MVSPYIVPSIASVVEAFGMILWVYACDYHHKATYISDRPQRRRERCAHLSFVLGAVSAIVFTLGNGGKLARHLINGFQSWSAIAGISLIIAPVMCLVQLVSYDWLFRYIKRTSPPRPRIYSESGLITKSNDLG